MKSFFENFTDSEKRKDFRLKFFNANRLLHSKKFWLFLALGYSIPTYYIATKSNEEYALKYSIFRKVSRITGSVGTVTIPRFLRKPLFSAYASVYSVNLGEIVEDIESFETFSKFFTRAIHPRPIDAQPLSIASPADSRILTFSEVSDDQVMIVKGIHYKLGELLTGVDSYQIRGEVLNSMKRNQANKLYQIVLYLAPGDYHRFHSPVDVTVKTRNHIVGDLAPVKESYVKTHSGVYEKNERVTVFGDWAKGMMSMVFVGALNVGSIDLNFDSELQTNKKLKLPLKRTEIKVYNDDQETGTKKGIFVKKGEEVGRFNVGSTIALVFEASPDFEWKIQPGEAVKYGQIIGLSK